MFELSAETRAQLKDRDLLELLEATAASTAESFILSDKAHIPVYSAYHFNAILLWFELQGVTAPESMRQMLELALTEAVANA